MKIALFTVGEFDHKTLVAALGLYNSDYRHFKIEVTWHCLELKETEPVACDSCFLVSDQGIRNLVLDLERVRKRLSGGVSLLVCAGSSPDTRNLMKKAGATQVISTMDWAPDRLAERFMAELYLGMPLELVSFFGYVGATPAMLELYYRISKYAAFGEPVLVCGESGSGKEVCAQALHHQGRPEQEFVAVNCGAISSDLVQSELFGHKKGSFSGAVNERKGLLAHAGAGTVFLDEIGDLRHEDQVKLLRVLEEKRMRPIGANTMEDIRARYVLATHRDLEKAASQGLFRHDLYQRIKPFMLRLPALRDHKADLLLLARAFVEEFNRSYDRDLLLPAEAHDCLFLYDWPGNVRELRGVIFNAAMFSDDSGPINLFELQKLISELVDEYRPQLALDQEPPHGEFITFSANDTWDVVEAKAWQACYQLALKRANGNKSKAADIMGVKRSTFYEKVKKYENQDLDTTD